MEEIGNKKRCRDEYSTDLPESKRRLIFELLDDDDVDSGVDLSDVIRTLEEEITAPAGAEASGSGPPPELDLGYLLEASDDELGLPPAVGWSEMSSDGGDAAVEEAAGFDRIWGYEDDVLTVPYQTEFEDGVSFDGGLFGWDDVSCGSPEYEDFSWRSDTLAAV